jgi:hypothetical protein
MTYRNEPDFEDFIDYNDISLPLAYSINNNIVSNTPLAETFINETWDLLLGALDVEEDTGFESIEELLGMSEG